MDFLRERVVWTHPDGDLTVTEYRNCPDLVPAEAREHLEAAKGGPVIVPRREVAPAVISKEGLVTKEAVTELVSVTDYKATLEARALLEVSAEEVAAVRRSP